MIAIANLALFGLLVVAAVRACFWVMKSGQDRGGDQ